MCSGSIGCFATEDLGIKIEIRSVLIKFVYDDTDFIYFLLNFLIVYKPLVWRCDGYPLLFAYHFLSNVFLNSKKQRVGASVRHADSKIVNREASHL